MLGKKATTCILSVALIGIIGLNNLFLLFRDHSYMHANSLISPFYESPWALVLLFFG